MASGIWKIRRGATFGGAAYKWLDLVLEGMNDPNVEQSIRVAILEWAADALAQKGRCPILGQAFYQWPDDLLKRGREQMKRATEDQNPYLAAKAKELLKRVEEAAAKRSA